MNLLWRLNLLLDPCLFKASISRVTGRAFCGKRKGRVGNWTVPDDMISLAVSYKLTIMFFYYFEYFSVKIIRHKEPL